MPRENLAGDMGVVGTDLHRPTLETRIGLLSPVETRTDDMPISCQAPATSAGARQRSPRFARAAINHWRHAFGEMERDSPA